MKVKELMIGDWVRIEDEEYGIHANYKVHHMEDYNREIGITVASKGLIFFDDVIKPIPLTAEILEKNGWDMYGCPDHKCWEYCLGASEYGKQDVPFSICLFDYMNKGSMYGDDLYEQIIIHVRFVHELQHALRLCGLTELADNFKI